MARMNDFELMIVRHGVAEDRHDQGDAARRLTPAGEQRLRDAVATWAALEWRWDVALTSPYARALSTAQILHEGLNQGALEAHGAPLSDPEIEPALVPHGDLDEAIAKVLSEGRLLAGPRPRVALFSHNPMVGRLASLLVCGDDQGQFNFGKGDLLHLFIPAPSHFDLVLAPQQREPAPRAVVLGFYPSSAQIAMASAYRR